MKKIYLSGIQEITKALKDGKIVFEEDTNNHTDKYRAIRLINGIIISSYVGKTYNSIFMNDYICLNAGDSKFYIEEKQPVKLEVGKFYKNENGDKCVCVYKSDDKKYQNRFLMIIIGALPENNKYCVDEEGKTDDYKFNPYNIVDYWEE